LCSEKRQQDSLDSTSLKICHGKRIKSNKVFKGLAKIGKSTKGWFFGFKLHIIIDEKGNLINAKLTKGNEDDRSVASQMTAGRDFSSPIRG
jgi:hypothetical protein